MRARDLLPWRDFTIETSWSPEVAALELGRRVGARSFFARAHGSGDEPFVGEERDGKTFRL